MNKSDRRVLIWLSAVSGIGAQTLKKVLEKQQTSHISLKTVISKRSSMDYSIFSAKQRVSIEALKTEYTPEDYEEFLQEKGVTVVCWGDEAYPELLREIPDYPVVLYVKGPTALWRTLPIAVVGTRHLTPYGEQATRILSRELSELGATIISGFMYGADLLAHQTAIKSGGKTVGVLGYGFDSLPDESSEYQTTSFLASGNTLVSELPPFSSGNKGTFPVRNRIVAGISHATVVTEAAHQSGSLITAHCAVNYGRFVYAVPGPLTSIYSEGTKSLINEGAKLVTSGLEIIEEIFPTLEHTRIKKIQKNTQYKKRI